MARKVTLRRVRAAIAADEYAGFCLKCGADAEGVEPDARKYRCDECGALAVYGAEEVALMIAVRAPRRWVEQDDVRPVAIGAD